MNKQLDTVHWCSKLNKDNFDIIHKKLITKHLFYWYKNWRTYSKIHPTMYRNYLKIAFRNLLKNKASTLINIGSEVLEE